jgi:hypothetical protein
MRRIVAVLITLTVVVGVVILGSGERAARTLAGWGLPIPGWCQLQIAADSPGSEDSRRTLSNAQARDVTALALTDPESLEAEVRDALGRQGTLACTVRVAGDLVTQEPLANGLTPRAEALRESVREAFGRIPDGGYTSEGIDSGRVPNSAHYDGRAIDYFFRPVGDAQQRERGWLLSHWLVARAADQSVATVIFDDRIWTARRSGQGWREYVHPSGNRTNEVLRHLDHVHVDVQRGTEPQQR